MYITDNDDGRICKYSFFYTEDYMYKKKNNTKKQCANGLRTFGFYTPYLVLV